MSEWEKDKWPMLHLLPGQKPPPGHRGPIIIFVDGKHRVSYDWENNWTTWTDYDYPNGPLTIEGAH